jgi:glutathione S-transferase
VLVFYYSPGSSSLAVHIALNEIGAPFEARPVLVATKETRKPEFLAINPEGKVPSLLIDGQLLTEVLAIVFYLGEKYPQAKLLPESLEGKAQALSWMSFLASTVHGARGDAGEARAAFDLTAQRLGDKEWALGDYSVADIFPFRLFWCFAAASNSRRMSFLRSKRIGRGCWRGRPSSRRCCRERDRRESRSYTSLKSAGLNSR